MSQFAHALFVYTDNLCYYDDKMIDVVPSPKIRMMLSTCIISSGDHIKIYILKVKRINSVISLSINSGLVSIILCNSFEHHHFSDN